VIDTLQKICYNKERSIISAISTMIKITVSEGREGFRESVAKVIRLSGVDPEEVPSLLRDVLRDDFDLPVEAVFAQLF
jgi:hypothetical protein